MRYPGRFARIVVAAFLFGVIGIGPPPLRAAEVADGELIAKLIPQKPGRKARFSGTFADVPIDSETYGSAPPNTPVPINYHPHKVQAVTLRLENARIPPRPPEPDAPGFDRQYYFVLSVRLADLKKPVFAYGDCWWQDRDIDIQTPVGPHHLERNTTSLHCGIECDGGGMSVVRVKNENAVLFRIDANGRLRMTKSCGGGGNDRNITFAGRETGAEFRFKPVRSPACRPLEKWLKRKG